MTCETVRQDLSGLLDDALEAPAARAVRQHVDSCDGCRAELESLEHLSKLLAARLEPDPGFIVRFRMRRDQAMEESMAWLPWRRLALRLAPLATAAVIGVTAGFWLSTPSEPIVERTAWYELESREWGSDQAMADEELMARPALHIAMEPFPGGLP